jgi:very-short-patch-repair endonuclease
MKQLADPNCHFGWPKGESYPESIFRSFLESMGAIKGQDFFQEYHVGTYSLDFAYIDEQGKRDIEIDGNQHLLPKRREHDARRDQWLIQQGWIVFRITVKDLYQWLYSLGFDRISRTMNTGGSQHKM